MIEARVDLSEAHRALIKLRSPDLRPAFKDARKPLRDDIRDHRRRREGPNGKWPARSAATRTRSGSRKRSRPMLGKLPTALQTLVDPRRIAMVSRVAWSNIPQTGGIAGNGARIPAREFLWASATVLGKVAELVTGHLTRIFQGKR